MSHHSNPLDPPTDLEADIGPPDPRQQETQWADEDEYERFIRDREEHFRDPDLMFLLRRIDEQRKEIDVLSRVFCSLHAAAQTLAYEVSVRPQDDDDWNPASHDWDPVRRALDILATELLKTCHRLGKSRTLN